MTPEEKRGAREARHLALLRKLARRPFVELDPSEAAEYVRMERLRALRALREQRRNETRKRR